MYKPATQFTVTLLGLYTALWGFWLANPFWSVFDQSSVYVTMSALAPEVSWGCSALLASALILYGAWHRSYWGLRVGGAVIAIYWLIIAIMYLVSDWHNTGGITTLLLALWGAYTYINCKLNRYNLFPNGGSCGENKRGWGNSS